MSFLFFRLHFLSFSSFVLLYLLLPVRCFSFVSVTYFFCLPFSDPSPCLLSSSSLLLRSFFSLFSSTFPSYLSSSRLSCHFLPPSPSSSSSSFFMFSLILLNLTKSPYNEMLSFIQQSLASVPLSHPPQPPTHPYTLTILITPSLSSQPHHHFSIILSRHSIAIPHHDH